MGSSTTCSFENAERALQASEINCRNNGKRYPSGFISNERKGKIFTSTQKKNEVSQDKSITKKCNNNQSVSLDKNNIRANVVYNTNFSSNNNEKQYPIYSNMNELLQTELGTINSNDDSNIIKLVQKICLGKIYNEKKISKENGIIIHSSNLPNATDIIPSIVKQFIKIYKQVKTLSKGTETSKSCLNLFSNISTLSLDKEDIKLNFKSINKNSDIIKDIIADIEKKSKVSKVYNDFHQIHNIEILADMGRKLLVLLFYSLDHWKCIQSEFAQVILNQIENICSDLGSDYDNISIISNSIKKYLEVTKTLIPEISTVEISGLTSLNNSLPDLEDSTKKNSESTLLRSSQPDEKNFFWQVDEDQLEIDLKSTRIPILKEHQNDSNTELMYEFLPNSLNTKQYNNSSDKLDYVNKSIISNEINDHFYSTEKIYESSTDYTKVTYMDHNDTMLNYQQSLGVNMDSSSIDYNINNNLKLDEYLQNTDAVDQQTYYAVEDLTYNSQSQSKNEHINENPNRDKILSAISVTVENKNSHNDISFNLKNISEDNFSYHIENNKFDSFGIENSCINQLESNRESTISIDRKIIHGNLNTNCDTKRHDDSIPDKTIISSFEVTSPSDIQSKKEKIFLSDSKDIDSINKTLNKKRRSSNIKNFDSKYEINNGLQSFSNMTINFNNLTDHSQHESITKPDEKDIMNDRLHKFNEEYNTDKNLILDNIKQNSMNNNSEIEVKCDTHTQVESTKIRDAYNLGQRIINTINQNSPHVETLGNNFKPKILNEYNNNSAMILNEQNCNTYIINNTRPRGVYKDDTLVNNEEIGYSINSLDSKTNYKESELNKTIFENRVYTDQLNQSVNITSSKSDTNNNQNYNSNIRYSNRVCDTTRIESENKDFINNVNDTSSEKDLISLIVSSDTYMHISFKSKVSAKHWQIEADKYSTIISTPKLQFEVTCNDKSYNNENINDKNDFYKNSNNSEYSKENECFYKDNDILLQSLPKYIEDDNITPISSPIEQINKNVFQIKDIIDEQSTEVLLKDKISSFADILIDIVLPDDTISLKTKLFNSYLYNKSDKYLQINNRKFPTKQIISNKYDYKNDMKQFNKRPTFKYNNIELLNQTINKDFPIFNSLINENNSKQFVEDKYFINQELTQRPTFKRDSALHKNNQEYMNSNQDFEISSSQLKKGNKLDQSDSRRFINNNISNNIELNNNSENIYTNSNMLNDTCFINKENIINIDYKNISNNKNVKSNLNQDSEYIQKNSLNYSDNYEKTNSYNISSYVTQQDILKNNINVDVYNNIISEKISISATSNKNESSSICSKISNTEANYSDSDLHILQDNSLINPLSNNSEKSLSILKTNIISKLSKNELEEKCDINNMSKSKQNQFDFHEKKTNTDGEIQEKSSHVGFIKENINVNNYNKIEDYIELEYRSISKGKNDTTRFGYDFENETHQVNDKINKIKNTSLISNESENIEKKHLDLYTVRIKNNISEITDNKRMNNNHLTDYPTNSKSNSKTFQDNKTTKTLTKSHSRTNIIGNSDNKTHNGNIDSSINDMDENLVVNTVNKIFNTNNMSDKVPVYNTQLNNHNNIYYNNSDNQFNKSKLQFNERSQSNLKDSDLNKNIHSSNQSYLTKNAKYEINSSKVLNNCDTYTIKNTENLIQITDNKIKSKNNANNRYFENLSEYNHTNKVEKYNKDIIKVNEKSNKTYCDTSNKVTDTNSITEECKYGNIDKRNTNTDYNHIKSDNIKTSRFIDKNTTMENSFELIPADMDYFTKTQRSYIQNLNSDPYYIGNELIINRSGDQWLDYRIYSTNYDEYNSFHTSVLYKTLHGPKALETTAPTVSTVEKVTVSHVDSLENYTQILPAENISRVYKLIFTDSKENSLYSNKQDINEKNNICSKEKEINTLLDSNNLDEICNTENDISSIKDIAKDCISNESNNIKYEKIEVIKPTAGSPSKVIKCLKFTNDQKTQTAPELNSDSIAVRGFDCYHRLSALFSQKDTDNDNDIIKSKPFILGIGNSRNDELPRKFYNSSQSLKQNCVDCNKSETFTTSLNYNDNNFTPEKSFVSQRNTNLSNQQLDKTSELIYSNDFTTNEISSNYGNGNISESTQETNKNMSFKFVNHVINEVNKNILPDYQDYSQCGTVTNYESTDQINDYKLSNRDLSNQRNAYIQTSDFNNEILNDIPIDSSNTINSIHYNEKHESVNTFEQEIIKSYNYDDYINNTLKEDIYYPLSDLVEMRELSSVNNNYIENITSLSKHNKDTKLHYNHKFEQKYGNFDISNSEYDLEQNYQSYYMSDPSENLIPSVNIQNKNNILQHKINEISNIQTDSPEINNISDKLIQSEKLNEPNFTKAGIQKLNYFNSDNVKVQNEKRNINSNRINNIPSTISQQEFRYKNDRGNPIKKKQNAVTDTDLYKANVYNSNISCNTVNHNCQPLYSRDYHGEKKDPFNNSSEIDISESKNKGGNKKRSGRNNDKIFKDTNQSVSTITSNYNKSDCQRVKQTNAKRL